MLNVLISAIVHVRVWYMVASDHLHCTYSSNSYNMIQGCFHGYMYTGSASPYLNGND